MDFLLLTVAVLVLLLAGLGLSLLMLPARAPRVAEIMGLSILFGSAVVSLLLFILGFLFSGPGLRWSVTVICLAICLIGLWRKGMPIKLGDLQPGDRQAKLLFTLCLIQVCLIYWLSFIRVLGWDGLFNFEIKARLAFQNGGTLPLEFLSDPSRSWTLQNYPLLLPMTENWLYLWVGRADQQLVKIIFPLFFIAAFCLFDAGHRLFDIRSWRRLVAPLLIFTAPLLVIGDGSASSGYADFPLAVFYLGAVIYLIEFWRNGDGKAIRLAGTIAAFACWLKQEGAILWFCVAVFALIKLALSRLTWSECKELLKAFSPGLFVILGWQAFVHEFALPGINQFQPVTLFTLRDNLWRTPIIVQSVLSELIDLRHWGLFWLIVAAATFWLLWRMKEREIILLSSSVLLPLAFYSGVYIFSLWPSFVTHLESSFPRLLIHISLVAVLTIAVAAKCLVIERGNRDQT